VDEKATIYLLLHFHYGPEWIENQATFAPRAFDLVNTYVHQCEKDPAYRVLLSESDCLKPFSSTSRADETPCRHW